MPDDILIAIIQQAPIAAGLLLAIYLLWKVVIYQRSEKEACQDENRRLVDLLVKHSNLDASAILNHNEDT